MTDKQTVIADSFKTLIYAENDGSDYDPKTRTGSYPIAIQFTSPKDHIVTGVEVFTGLRTGPNKIGIWSHNAAEDIPSKELGSGSWEMDRVCMWQGAGLTAQVPIAKDNIYWVVWEVVDFSQHSVLADSTNGATQTYCATLDKYQTWYGPLGKAQHKFRLFGV